MVNTRTTGVLGALLLVACLAGCVTDPRCPTSEDLHARYIGPYLGVENNLSSDDFARDMYCANDFKSKNFPKGYVTVFGSSKIMKSNNNGSPEINRANDQLYEQIESFAKQWTLLYGSSFPIMTGAGPGLMEAANRGAREAGSTSHSIGYTTYYDDPTPKSDATHPYGGEASKLYNKDNITDALIFSSIAMREDAMILHSAAIVIAPGGTGTEWETFQILETLKSKQLTPVPVYFVGDRNTYWASLIALLCDMSHHMTLNTGAFTFFEFVDDPTAVVGRLKDSLIDQHAIRAQPPTCPRAP